MLNFAKLENKNMPNKNNKEEDKSEIEPLGGEKQTSDHDKDIKELLKKNLELNSEIFEMVQYVKKYIFWRKIWSFLKILIIVVPLVLAFIYLPPFLKGVYDNYKVFIEDNLNIELPDKLNINSMSEVMSENNITAEDMETFSNMSAEEKQGLIDEYNNMSAEEKQQALQELNKK